MFKLLISSKAKEKIKLLRKQDQKAIILVLEEIKESPFIGKPLTRELTGFFSIRVGINRIIYKVNRKDKVIIIITAGHRAKIYN